MSRKLALGLVAAASLGAAALAPTAASAHPIGWGWGFHHPHFYPHFGLGLGFVGVTNPCLVREPVLTPFGYRMRIVYVCY